MRKNKVLMVLVSLILPFLLGVQVAMADTSDSAQTCLRGLLYMDNGCTTVDYMSIDYLGGRQAPQNSCGVII
ncbi:MAG: hypothetical protein F6K26_53770 [Moorea sp. SIO2I5]|nr:hypothetical protein [Moorena sp. SIO2I5]